MTQKNGHHLCMVPNQIPVKNETFASFFSIFIMVLKQERNISFLHDILEKIKTYTKLDLSLEYEQWEMDIPPYFLLYWWSTGRLNCISLNILEFRAQDKEEVLIKLWPPLYGHQNSYLVGSKEFYLLSGFFYRSHKILRGKQHIFYSVSVSV